MNVTASRVSAGPAKLTLKDHLIHLLPRLASDEAAPNWPPDMFALCMSALCASGSYCRALTNWPPEKEGQDCAGCPRLHPLTLSLRTIEGAPSFATKLVVGFWALAQRVG